MSRKVIGLLALVTLASACDDNGVLFRLKAARNELDKRIQDRKLHLDEPEFRRQEQELLRERLQEIRHVATGEELRTKVAAFPEPVRVEVLEELADRDAPTWRGARMLRVRFSGATRDTMPQGANEALRFDFLSLDAFQSDETGWSAEGRLHLTHPCEHPSWDEEPVMAYVPDPGMFDGMLTRRMRDEAVRGSRELAALDTQLKALGVAELPRLKRCTELMLSHLEQVRRDSVMSAWYSLWETFPMARGRLSREGEVVTFKGRFPGDTRGVARVRAQGPGDWKWEDSDLKERYELVEFSHEGGVLKLRPRQDTRL